MTGFLSRKGRLAGGSTLRRNISMTLVRQILVNVAQLMLVVLIARQLGAEGNGHYAMALLLPTLLVNFLNLGVAPATVYYVGRSEFTAWQAARENLRLGVAITTVGVAFALPVLLVWGESLFPDVPQHLLLAGLAAFPVSLLLAYLNSIFQGLEDFRIFNTTTLLPPYVALVGVVIALYGLQAGVLGAVLAYLLGQSVGLLLVILLLARRTRGASAECGPREVLDYRRKTIQYGWKAHLSNIMAFVNYRADIFLVNFFLNPVATGLYVVAVQIAEGLWMLSHAASAVLLPRLSAMHEDPHARLALTRKSFMVVSGLTTVASAVAAVALYWFLGPIFGEQYWEALPAFLLLLPGIVAGAGSRMQSNCIAAAGKPEWNTYVAAMVVCVNVALNIVLIPILDISGAAMATSVAYIMNAIIKNAMVKKI